MRSTRTTPTTGCYVGVDLTDAFSRSPRPTDVCGLRRTERGLEVELWAWLFEPNDRDALDVTALLDEIGGARGVVIDGPQGLATVGASVRDCERALGAPGRTPDSLADTRRPYAGFVKTSVMLFSALSARGIACGAQSLVGGVAEQYPGGTWRRLGGALGKKATIAGRLARRRAVEALGVVFPTERLPTHDQLDACLGALLAAAHDGAVPGVTITRVGAPLTLGPPLREGEILILQVAGAATRPYVSAAVPKLPRNTAPGAPSTMLLSCTRPMVERRTPAIAVSGVAHLNATANAPLRLDLGAEGQLVLGDHTMFWEKHQQDELAARTFAKLLAELRCAPGAQRELEVRTMAHPPERLG